MDEEYFPGINCTCCARSDNECSCAVDWRSFREVELEAFISELINQDLSERMNEAIKNLSIEALERAQREEE